MGVFHKNKTHNNEPKKGRKGIFGYLWITPLSKVIIFFKSISLPGSISSQTNLSSIFYFLKKKENQKIESIEKMEYDENICLTFYLDYLPSQNS